MGQHTARRTTGAYSRPLDRPSQSGSPRLPALDGLRAAAVLAVLLYHGGVSWVHGGLLGVDVFFVLSGFLITSLLCDESARTGTLMVAKFWGRRARRLLPALFVLLLGVAVYAFCYSASLDLTRIRGDALSTLAYVANWRFILSDQGYFATSGAPSPLLHTWSLAVEEQYYLVWPLIALAALRLRGPRALAVVAGFGAVASAVLMAVMYHLGFGIDRLYYGTDTRAQSLLVGSFLGVVACRQRWRLFPERWCETAGGRRFGVLLDIAGGGFLVWAGHVYGGTDPFLYTGGFFLVALATAAVIARVISWPRSLLARFLSLPVLTFVGRISYGLYLYHWPLFLAINNAHTGLNGAPLLALRLVVTFTAAVLSYELLEQPIRTRRLLPTWHATVASGVAAAVTVTALVATTVAPAAASVSIDGAAVMPPAEHQQLAATSAFTTNPVRFLLLGDSVALTMGIGLSHQSKRNFGVRLYDGAALGCDLDPTLMVKVSGHVGLATPGCRNWQSVWANGLASIRPQVVGLALGRWEVTDHLYRGQWTHVGQPLWDHHLLADLNEAVTVLSSEGAKVALFTMPYLDPPNEAANGTPFPENLPSRANAYNALVRTVALERPGVVTLVDLNRYLDPGGHYTATIGRLTVRWADGIHVSMVGGEWLQPEILPTVAALGLAARLTPPNDVAGRWAGWPVSPTAVQPLLEMGRLGANGGAGSVPG